MATTLSPREELIARIESMSDEQVTRFLQFVDQLLAEITDSDSTNKQQSTLQHYTEVMESPTLPDNYDPDNDPSIGFFSSSPDLATRSKEILRREFGLRNPQNDISE